MRNMDVAGKTVLVRVDFNCPLKDGEVADDNRIQAALPTIKYLVDKNAKLVLMSHLGRPKGEPDPKLSLAPVAKKLGEILGREVKMAPDCVGPEVKNLVASMGSGDIVVLENLRFHPEEKKDNEEFAKQLAELADVVEVHRPLRAPPKRPRPPAPGARLVRDDDLFDLTL